MTSTYTSYSLIARDLQRSLSTVKSQPLVERETRYYRDTISTIKSADEFVSNKRLLNFAMTAFGLKDMAYATAFVRKILKEGRDDNTAFVNRLADNRYLEFAKTFDFKRHGAVTTTFTAVQQGVIDKYTRATLETQAGDNNEGVRLALYFERNAAKLQSVEEILADKALSQVVKTTLRLPDVFSLSDIDKQIAVLDARIDLDDFKSPAKLTQFLKRFTTLWDVDQTSSTDSGIASLFGQSGQFGISSAVMASLSKLRR